MVRHRSRTRISLLFILGLVLLAVVVRPHGSTCGSEGPGGIAGSLGGALSPDIVLVPCASTGRTSYNTRDNLGEPMDALDPIDDPAGGYLGVYHTPFRAKPGGPLSYRVSLARSANLIQWTRVRVLDAGGASMATLTAIPGHPGYLLAYEKSAGVDFIRVLFYPTLSALRQGRAAAGVSLPLRFSPFSNGTPSFVSVDWPGGPAQSTIRLAFHYEAPLGDGRPGPDREATGTLHGFRTWDAQRDQAIDAALTRSGLLGNHGDRRQFTFNGSQWRIYEAQTKLGDFASWHVLLYDVASRQFEPLDLRLADGQFATSFGNPIVHVLHAPHSHAEILAVTVFVFGTGQAAREAGELVYYQPLA